jgi:hypothetical protein
MRIVPKGDEGPEDSDVGFDGFLTIEHARQHGHAVLGKSKRWVTSTAPT